MSEIMPSRGELQQRLDAALEEFFADAHLEARFPSHLLNAMRSSEVYAARITVRGVPVSVTGMGCGMDTGQAGETGRLIYRLPLQAGARIRIDGPGLVHVEQPEVTA